MGGACQAALLSNNFGLHLVFSMSQQITAGTDNIQTQLVKHSPAKKCKNLHDAAPLLACLPFVMSLCHETACPFQYSIYITWTYSNLLRTSKTYRSSMMQVGQDDMERCLKAVMSMTCSEAAADALIVCFAG